jgi:hypothetical protein
MTLANKLSAAFFTIALFITCFLSLFAEIVLRG